MRQDPKVHLTSISHFRENYNHAQNHAENLALTFAWLTLERNQEKVSSVNFVSFFILLLVTKSYLLQPHGLLPVRLLCPWVFSGKNTGVGCHALLQKILGVYFAKNYLNFRYSEWVLRWGGSNNYCCAISLRTLN